MAISQSLRDSFLARSEWWMWQDTRPFNYNRLDELETIFWDDTKELNDIRNEYGIPKNLVNMLDENWPEVRKLHSWCDLLLYIAAE